MGDDQNESYKEDCRPAFAIYYGDTIRNANEQHEDLSPALSRMVHQEPRRASSRTDKPRDYPVHSALAVASDRMR